ncbi:hypothetical protein PIB30_001671 [Stylosanthes scabra]|uniref:Uncharacterized protein n=1 Tax=Stylosanthes scabra TaxID=79078 RepID=A0ABU6T318_9FABA|nr:hypothetical protein [Stylosanthes scabra]
MQNFKPTQNPKFKSVHPTLMFQFVQLSMTEQLHSAATPRGGVDDSTTTSAARSIAVSRRRRRPGKPEDGAIVLERRPVTSLDRDCDTEDDELTAADDTKQHSEGLQHAIVKAAPPSNGVQQRVFRVPRSCSFVGKPTPLLAAVFPWDRDVVRTETKQEGMALPDAGEVGRSSI